MTAKRDLAVLLTVTAVLAGCPGADFATCRGEVVSHPLGQCSAYYYQADYRSGGQTTQALVECSVPPSRLGGNVVAFHTLAHGIGLRWLDPHTLEVAVPAGVALQDQRESATYAGTSLRYVYRELSATEAPFHGCGLADTEAGT